MSKKLDGDIRPTLKLLIEQQERIKASAEKELVSLKRLYAENEKTLPLVWAIMPNAIAEGEQPKAYWASRSRFDTEQVYLSSNNVQEYYYIKEMTVEEAVRQGIEFKRKEQGV